MQSTWDDLVVVGEVARPHGLRGHVVVRPQTDFPEERFKPGSEVLALVGGRSVRKLVVSECRWQSRRLVVGFEGLSSIEDAEALGRTDLRIAVADLRRLPTGAFYRHDLVGCEVRTEGGHQVGVVTAVEEAGTASLVITGDHGEVLVPLAAEICVAIDVASRQITIAPPVGLLEVNLTGASRGGLRRAARELNG